MKKYITFTCIVSCLVFGARRAKRVRFATEWPATWSPTAASKPGTSQVGPSPATTSPGRRVTCMASRARTWSTNQSEQRLVSGLLRHPRLQRHQALAGHHHHGRRPVHDHLLVAQDTASSSEYGNELLASFGGTSLVDDSDVVVEGYTEYTYNVGPVSGSSNTLELTFGNGLGEFLLDDVSVVDNVPW